jgi:predicted transcriptional regulator of viral defense system
VLSPSERALEQLFEDHQGILKRRQVVEAGLHPRLLSKWVQEGRAERLQPGLYRLSTAQPISHESLLEVTLRVPHGVICLASALALHQLGTVSPVEIQLAIPNKAWRPEIDYPPVRYFYFSKRVYEYGIESIDVDGRKIKAYSPEKTLADLLYYRNKVGKGIFLEGLKEYLDTPRRNIPKLTEAAALRRVNKLMGLYLEALT